MKKLIYLDNASTTKIANSTLNAIMPFLTEDFGNPSAVCSNGQYAKKAVENARNIVANAISADADEIYFTGSGTESVNWAIKSGVLAFNEKGRHIITSAIEHPAVMNTAKHLEANGYEVTYLGVDNLGQISLDELKSAIRKDTVLISIMAANNEIGTVLSVGEIGKIARENDVLFHTDATQAVGHVPIDVADMNIDLMSFSGHKLGGLKGTGVLYMKKGLPLEPLIHGGGQESGKRSGTENVVGIVSLGAALENTMAQMPHYETIRLRDKLITELLKIPHSQLTGDPENRLPGIASFVFKAIEGESMLLMLDHFGICASSGSACSSGSLDPSHVLLAIGLSHEVAHGSLRLSIGSHNTEEDIDFVIEKLPEIVDKLRQMSPIWNGN